MTFLGYVHNQALTRVELHVPCHCRFGELVEIGLESMMVRMLFDCPVDQCVVCKEPDLGI